MLLPQDDFKVIKINDNKYLLCASALQVKEVKVVEDVDAKDVDIQIHLNKNMLRKLGNDINRVFDLRFGFCEECKLTNVYINDDGLCNWCHCYKKTLS